MVEEKHRDLLSQILELLDTACQANLELLERYGGGEQEAARTLLADLRSVVQAVASAQEPLLPRLEHAYTEDMLENVGDTLDDIQRSMEAGNSERAAMKLEFQLFPFLRCLRAAFYFYGLICPDPEKMRQYYLEDFAKSYQNFYVNLAEEPELRLSIIVTGYNHLETTRQCVEQLLKETDFEKLNAELILIDHGSTDGTLEYFESLGVGKVIHFKKNVRMNVFSMLFEICRGKFFAFVSNDILVTRDWADILLRCLESDEKIIAAVPATPNIANLQTVGLPELGPKEYIAWANQQNKSDPSRWNDRARLMPPLGMYRTEAVNRIGFADPYLYSMEFWDDDFSFRARRAGYRQILCNDVTCYHFGSVTGKEGQKTEGTLVYGRELFRKKNGVDAWSSGFCYDYTAVQIWKQLPLPQENICFLGLDCGMGDTPLQIRNERRRLHQSCEMYQITGQKEYWPDLSALFSNAVFSSDLADGVAGAFEGTVFSAAHIGRDIGCYEDLHGLLKAVSGRLQPKGCLLFSCANPFFVITLHSLLQFTVPGKQCALADPRHIHQIAEAIFPKVQMFPVKQSVEGAEAFAKAHFGAGKHLSAIIEKLSVSAYYFVCQKRGDSMRLCWEEDALWKKRKLAVIQKINERKLPLVLFGRAYPVKPDFLEGITVPVQYICDNDPATWGSSLWGLEIIAPAMLQAIYRAYTVLILVRFEHEIIPQLQQLPIPPAEIFRLDLYFEEEGSAAYLQEMQPVIDDTCRRLADQKSRDTYEAVLQYRIGRNAECLSHVAERRSEQYFPDSLGGRKFLGTEEIFVDAGAFTGDTVRQFISAVQGKYRAIYAFEPEPEAWAKLLKNTAQYSNVVCRQAGLGEESKAVGFSFGAASSKVDAAGEQQVQIETLDHLLGDVPVTYLKMDIEGMERPALCGARKLIPSYHPKLAICAYHSNADMVRIPQLIWELDPSYQIYFRHYSHALVETVCYAI